MLSTPNPVENLGKTLCSAIEIDLKAIWVSVRKLQIQMTTVACPDSMEMKCKACRLCFMLKTYSMWVCQRVCMCVCMCVRHSWQLEWKSLPIVSQWSRAGLIASSYFHLQTTVFILACTCACINGYICLQIHAHIYRYRDRARYRQGHANWGSARCLHWKFKFFCY